ncbi:glycosyltransferase [Ferrovibrio terrae]|uniref:glycosyltransferase family 2 protein n=1 Tax=Ferrovibrio terrae TaxID=2594003 RepID=UPI003137F221
MKICAIIPSHNHWTALDGVLTPLLAAGLAIFIIDDGSAEPARSALATRHDPTRDVIVHRLAVNQGKGGAVLAGMALAREAGFTHALQVDADGQHDLGRLTDLLALARQYPQALVTGVPVYDNTIPLGRAIGRWITHVWVWIETLSFQIRDSMCGYRVYPLAAVWDLQADGETLGQRMDFDTEIMVRLFWRGTPVAQLPVRVTYPPGNTSNFDVVRDNLRISAMHARLFFTMLWCLPQVLKHRAAPLSAEPIHWARLSERGLYWGLRFCSALYRLLGHRLSHAAIAPIVLFFYLTGNEQRRTSREFLIRAFAARGETRQPGFWSGYRHFFSFAGRTLDSLAAWSGSLSPDKMDGDDADSLRLAMADPRGAVIIVSHVGNIEVSRALIDPAIRRRLLVLVHTQHAANYNRVLREINPETALNTFQVTDLDAATAVLLKERVDQGDWIVIAGDRVPVSGDRVSVAPFLGQPAAFPQGPYILAAVMECPLYTLFCRREGGRFHLTGRRLADRVTLPRGQRMEALDGYAGAFARELEEQALLDPFQWYNFFDFWAMKKDAVTS